MNRRSLSCIRTALANASVITALASPLCSQIELESYQSLEVFGGHREVVTASTGDFDGDGKLDLIVGIRLPGNDQKIRLLRGTGGVGFERVATAGSATPGPIATADFDGDGHLDFVAGESGLKRLLIRLGEGDFTFPRSRLIPLDSYVVELDLSDLNGDGILDIAVASADFRVPEGPIHIALGRHFGMFDEVRTYTLDTNPTSIASGDFDEDGKPDLVTTEASGILTVFFGDGAGGFPVRAPSIVGSSSEQPHSLEVNDLDGDGHQDVAFLISETSSLYLLYGDGTGSFPETRTVSVSPNPRTLCVDDFNRDGFPDTVVSSSGIDPLSGLAPGDDQILSLYLGSERRDPSPPVQAKVCDDLLQLMPGDVTGDGRQDLVAVGYSLGTVFLLPGEGLAGFRTPVCSDAGYSPSSLSLADFNRDGHLDVVLVRGDHAQRNRDAILIHRGDGRGAFTFDRGFRFLDLPAQFIQVRAVDLDHDGHIDLVARFNRDLTEFVRPALVAVLRADGLNGFDPPVILSAPDGRGQLLVEDFDGDGHPDILTSHEDDACFALFSGDGLGEVAPFQHIPFFGEGLVSTDFNRDDILDLAYSRDGEAYLLPGDGTGNFHPERTVGSLGSQLAAADVNGDGFVDLVASEYPGLRTAFGDGTGGFSIGSMSLSEGPLTSLSLRDLDEDGALDVIARRLDRGQIVVARGDGTGGFIDPSRFAGGSYLRCPLVEDLDEDGHLDVLVAQNFSGNPGDGLLAFLRNRTFDAVDSLRGNVDERSGTTKDVLFVNGAAGSGEERIVAVTPSAPFRLFLDHPPSQRSAQYVVWAVPGRLSLDEIETLPLGIGKMAFFTPLMNYPTLAAWNTLGRHSFLGTPTFPSALAPTTLLDLPSGIGRQAMFRVQGLITDPRSPGGRIAVTNGITVVVDESAR